MPPRRKKTPKATTGSAGAGPAVTTTTTKPKGKATSKKTAAARSRAAPTNAPTAVAPEPPTTAVENGASATADNIEAAPVPTAGRSGSGKPSTSTTATKPGKQGASKRGANAGATASPPAKPASKKRAAPADSPSVRPPANGSNAAGAEAPVPKKRALATKEDANVPAVDTDAVEAAEVAEVDKEVVNRAAAVGKKRGGGAGRQTGRPAKVQKTGPGRTAGGASTSAKHAAGANGGLNGRARVFAKPEYEDVWKEVYLAGTEWDQMQGVYAVDWDFEHLDQALSQGDLAMRDVYLFGATEPQLLMRDEKDEKGEVIPIPVIIAVVSELPPPSTVGIKSVQRTTEEIVPMSDLRMMWQTYAPPNVLHRVGCKSYVHVLTCSQRKARLRNMENEAVHRYDYVLPYFFNPDKQEDVAENTEVQVLADLEGIQVPLMCTYDYEMDELDEFVEEKMTEDGLDGSKYADGLKKAIQEAVKSTKLKYKAEREELKKKVEAVSAEERESIKKMKLIKFYPMNEWPDISTAKSTYVNRYYGHANEVRDDVPDE